MRRVFNVAMKLTRSLTNVVLQRVCEAIGDSGRSRRVTRFNEGVFTANERLQERGGICARRWRQVASRDDANEQLHGLHKSQHFADTTHSGRTAHASSRHGEGTWASCASCVISIFNLSVCIIGIFQVIRTRTQINIPPAYKEILFMTRQISSAVCRNPEVYKEVCENILRVDISVLKSESHRHFPSVIEAAFQTTT